MIESSPGGRERSHSQTTVVSVLVAGGGGETGAF